MPECYHFLLNEMVTFMLLNELVYTFFILGGSLFLTMPWVIFKLHSYYFEKFNYIAVELERLKSMYCSIKLSESRIKIYRD